MFKVLYICLQPFLRYLIFYKKFRFFLIAHIVFSEDDDMTFIKSLEQNWRSTISTSVILQNSGRIGVFLITTTYFFIYNVFHIFYNQLQKKSLYQNVETFPILLLFKVFCELVRYYSGIVIFSAVRLGKENLFHSN